MTKTLRTGLAVGLIGTLSSCETGLLPSEDGEVARVEVVPRPAVVELGTTLQLEAKLEDASGNALNGRRVFWASENASIAEVSATGVLTGKALGTTRVAASAEGVDGLVDVTVVPRAVASVAVSPPEADILVGESMTLVAIARDDAGQVLEGREVTWTSADPRVVEVEDDGKLTGVAAGSTSVTATVEGKTGVATVEVAPRPVATVELSPAAADVFVGDETQFVATARASDGSVLEGREVAWSTSDPAVLTVSSKGLAHAVAAGEATVTADVEGVSTSAEVTVSVVPVARVEVSPATAELLVGEVQPFTARAKAADGRTLTGRAVEWTSSDPAVATVNASGVATASSPGKATLTATIEGKSAEAFVTVWPVPVATVEVSPTAAALKVGETRQFSAVTRAEDGSPLARRVVVWTSSDPAVATVNASGLVRAASPGEATITATSEGKSGDATVTVTPAPVATVEVSPATAELTVGETHELTAVTKAEDGSTLTGRAVEWTSSDPAVATVTPGGLVTGISPGEATITATSEGKSGDATVTVTPAPVATVEVSPATAEISTLGSIQLTAIVKAADGSTLTGRAVEWESSNPLVASVDEDGVVTGLLVGQVTITASSEGKSGTATVTVTLVSTTEGSPE